MNSKNKGKSPILVIVIVLIIVLSIVYAVFNYRQRKLADQKSYVTPAGLTVAKLNEKLQQNTWDGRIVNDVTEEEVPIPALYSYLEGNTNTGIIIKSNKLGKRYLFIPYDDKVEYKENEYYKKVRDYKEMSSLDLLSMKKYKGFFVELDSKYKMRDLKTINNKNYIKQSKKAKNIKDDNESINSHILSKEEIAQIDNYLGNNNISEKDNIGIAAITIEPFSKVNVSSTKTIKVSSSKKVSSRAKTEEEKYYYRNYTPTNTKKYKSGTTIPIPEGYNYCETKDEGVVLIQDNKNPYLIYVWVPLQANDIKYIRNTLMKNIYDAVTTDNKISQDSAVYKMITESIDNSSEFNDFKDSIEKFNGFYVSQAELSYSIKNNGEIDHYMNIARGMVDETVTKTEGNGDYIRGTSYSTGYTGLIESKKFVANTNKGVVPHVMFGTEYDAMLLWIAETNQDYTKDNKSIYNIIAQDSSSVGKYAGKIEGTSSAVIYPPFNEIWGIGGNLEELTQETYTDENKKEHYVTRGGSYLVTGDDYDTAMASRKSVNDDDIKSPNIGVRMSLFLDKDMTEDKKIKLEDFDYVEIGNAVVTKENEEEKTDIKFEEFNDEDGNNKRYTCDFDGVTLFSNLNDYSVIKTLGFAEQVEITEKATEETTYDNQNVWWVKVKSGDQEGYVNAYKITKDIENIGSADFVISYNGAVRYHSINTPVYEDTKEDSKPLYYTKYVGLIDIIGKSTDSKWALLTDKKIIPANNLTDDISDKEMVVQTNENAISFVKGPETEFYSIEEISIYSSPLSDSEEVIELNKGTKVTVSAISKDNKWFKVKKDTYEGYVYADKFISTLPEGVTKENAQEDENGNKWIMCDDEVHVTSSDVKVYSKPSTSAEIVATLTDNGENTSYKRTSWSEEKIEGDFWNKIELNKDGDIAYIQNTYISTNKTQSSGNEQLKTSTGNNGHDAPKAIEIQRVIKSTNNNWSKDEAKFIIMVEAFDGATVSSLKLWGSEEVPKLEESTENKICENFIFTAKTSGDYWFVAEDSKGAKSNQIVINDVKIDTEVPKIVQSPSVEFVENDGNKAVSSIDFYVSDYEGSGIDTNKIIVDGIDVVDNSNYSTTVLKGNEGDYRIVISFKNPVPSGHEFTIKIYDIAGNSLVFTETY